VLRPLTFDRATFVSTTEHIITGRGKILSLASIHWALQAWGWNSETFRCSSQRRLSVGSWWTTRPRSKGKLYSFTRRLTLGIASSRVRKSCTGSQKSGAPYLVETDLRSLPDSFTVSRACPTDSCSHRPASVSARANSHCFLRKACSASASARRASSSASFSASLKALADPLCF